MAKVSLLSGKNRAFIAIQNYSKDLVDGHAPDASKLRYLTQRCFRSRVSSGQHDLYNGRRAYKV